MKSSACPVCSGRRHVVAGRVLPGVLCPHCQGSGQKPRFRVRINGGPATEWERVEITRDPQPVKLREPARPQS